MKKLVMFSILASAPSFAGCLYASIDYPLHSIMKQVDSYRECALDQSSNFQWVDANLVEAQPGCLYADINYPEKSILQQINEYKICAQVDASQYRWEEFIF